MKSQGVILSVLMVFSIWVMGNVKRFKFSDPAVTPALAGRVRSWRLSDGTSWP